MGVCKTRNNDDISSKCKQNIELCTAITDSLKEAPITVGKENSHQQRKIFGPTIFFPEKNEYVHQFKWSIVNNKGELMKDKESFQVLQTGGNSVWKIGLPIITADSVQLLAVIAFNYQIEELEKCIAVKDPIQQFHTGVMVDGRILGNKLNSKQLLSEQEEMKQHQNLENEKEKEQEMNSITQLLSQKESYPYLCDAASQCGFRIDMIHVMGVIPSSEFQKQINKNQQATADISLEYKNKAKRRQVHELDMEDRRNQVKQEADLRMKQAQLNAWIEEESYQLKKAALDRRIELLQKEQDFALSLKKSEHDAVLNFLKAIKEEMDVDMTQFLCSTGGLSIATNALFFKSKSKTMQENHVHEKRLDEKHNDANTGEVTSKTVLPSFEEK